MREWTSDDRKSLIPFGEEYLDTEFFADWVGITVLISSLLDLDS